MLRSRAIALPVLTLLACTDFDFVPAPDNTGVRSAIVLWYSPGGAAHAEAFEGADYHVAVPGRKETVVVLHYDVSLDVFLIEPGPLEPDPNGRPLPKGRMFEREGDDFREISQLPDEAAAFRIAPLDAPRCYAQSGRCLEVVDQDLRCGACTRMLPVPPEAPLMPELPELPKFGACRPSWTPAIGPNGIPICVPNDPPRVGCGASEMQPFGAITCTRVGTECPAERFRDRVGALHVDPTAPAGGDGSLVAPYRSIQEALALAVPPVTILLAADTYQEGPLVLPDLVGLEGACAATSVRTPSIQLGRASISNLELDTQEIHVTGANAAIRDAILASSSVPLRVEVEPGDSAMLQGVALRGAGAAIEARRILSLSRVVADAGCFALTTSATSVDLDRVVVEVPPCEPAGASVRSVSGGADVTLHEVRLAGSMAISEGGSLRAADLAIRSAAPGAIQTGLQLEGARAVLDGVAIEGASEAAIEALTSVLTGVQVVLRDNRFGVRSLDSNVGLSEALLEGGGASTGAWVSGGTVELWNTAVDGAAIGVHLVRGTVTATRALVLNVTTAFVLEEGSLTLLHATIAGARAGVMALEDQMLHIEKAFIEDVEGAAIALGQPPNASPEEPCGQPLGGEGKVLLEDITIHNAGQGISIHRASAALDRVQMENVVAGLVSCDGTATSIMDLAVDGAVSPLEIRSRFTDIPIIGRLSVKSASSGPELRSVSGFKLSDVSLEGIETSGLEIHGYESTAAVVLDRVRVHDTGGVLLTRQGSLATDVEIMDSTGEGSTSLRVELGPLNLKRFRFSSSNTALRLIDVPDAQLADGVIEEQVVGVDVSNGPTPALINTTFLEVEVPVRCSGTGC